ncbi:lysophospholipid acyltransferase family protein [Variovorax sp. MHTC-1]|uniref:lysophospholipid acyltransferase family protein n=1 Tax=Variovorax sp. MHTC-1 TaxID=2495593 RepID=UPI000F85F74E|nr:lysophospholipid acyltransferase family protein [Variovorax sp. MHTC-1]RST54469.1 1-acyl-sn-glycerol-3-phosphate acyltransferase [Variovorax sp. MHTC-1]
MLAKFTGWALLVVIRLLTGAQARWWGCPPKAEQRIYFANHQSHLDLVMIWAALPEELRSITRPIAARDYWATSPFKRWITTEVFNAIYVERGGSAPVPPPAAAPAPSEERIEPSFDAVVQTELPLSPPVVETMEPTAPVVPGSAEALAPLQPLIEALQSGDSIIIFPEGTRGHTGEPQKFKSGLFTLAQMFPEVVLVPAWIDNVQRVMPKGEVVPVPILCSVTFGEPVRLEEGEERRPFLDRAREAVVALRYV